MGRMKALTLAGVLVAGAIHSASAADLLPPPPVLDAPLRGAIVESSGFYVRGDVGVGISGSTKLRQSFDAGFAVPGLAVDSEKRGDQAFVGLGAGYKFNNWFRADVTGEYRTGSDWSAIASYTCGSLSGRCYDHYKGRIANSVFLANAYADLGTWSGLTPFVGVGLGAAQHRFQSLTDADYQVGGFGYAKDKESWKFAWALMAGLGYDVTSNLKLELGYRYLNMGKATSNGIVCQNTLACGHEVQKVSMSSHDIRLGMRWMLNDTPAAPMAMAAPAPLVRKY